MYSLIICVEGAAWDLTETDRFSLRNVNHALKHIYSAYQLGCVQPVGIFGSVWNPHPGSFYNSQLILVKPASNSGSHLVSVSSRLKSVNFVYEAISLATPRLSRESMTKYTRYVYSHGLDTQLYLNCNCGKLEFCPFIMIITWIPYIFTQ